MLSFFYDTIITDALAAEWHSAVARLSPKQRQSLKPPLFTIDAEIGCWGMWCGGKQRRIVLKRALFQRHPWYVVKDVLRHEIAHQAREELYPQAAEAPHGPLFQKLCQQLGGRPDASGDYPLLDQVVYSSEECGDGESAASEGAVTPEARLMVRIRKLLSLSESPNRNEAEAALLKAREIAAKYAIDLAEAEQEPGKDGSGDSDQQRYTVTVGTPLRRISYEETLMGNLLQEFFNVMIVWEYTPDLENPGKELHLLSFSGTRRNLRIATYAYDCLCNYMRRAQFELPPLLLARTITSKRVLQDFRIGVLEGFRAKLQEQDKQPEMQQALMLADRSRLQEYLRWQFPSLRTRRPSHRSVDRDARQAGESAGRRFTLTPGLKSGEGGPSGRIADGKELLP